MEDNYMDNEEIVELIDEDGVPAKFVHLYTLEHKGEKYVLLSPAEPMEGLDEDELIILKIIPGADDGEDAYMSVEDETVLNEVFTKYLEIVEADED